YGLWFCELLARLYCVLIDMVRIAGFQRLVDEELLPVGPRDHLLEGAMRYDDLPAVRPDVTEHVRGDLPQAVALEVLARAPFQLVLAHPDRDSRFWDLV